VRRSLLLALAPAEERGAGVSARRQKRRDYEIDRRDAIKGMGLVAVLGLLSAASAGVLLSLFSTRRTRAQQGEFPLTYAASASGGQWFDAFAGRDVLETDLATGRWALAIAEGSGLTRPVIILRMAQPPADPQGSGGNIDTLVAFYSGCVHACCGVTGKDPALGVLHCECHFSTFDCTRLEKGSHSGASYVGAPPVSGPASRPLPLAPIAIDADGKVRLVIDTATYPKLRNREWYGYC
jgi:hypothetical protein